MIIRLNIWNWLFLGSLLVLVFSCADKDDLYYLDIKAFPDRNEDFSLWQLDQFFQEVQMGYIIKTDDNKIIVIDGGGLKSAPIIEDYLLQLGGKVDTWIVTHPHMDHIGVLLKVIEKKKVSINRILHSALDEDWVKINEEKSYNIIVNYNNVLKKSSISIIDAVVGMSFELGEGIDLKVFGTHNNTIFVNAVNNSSLVFRIQSKSKSVLFLGDLGVEGGNALLNNSNVLELKSKYVQMAHHGQNGVSKFFYGAVNADYTLWPSPKWLWENNLDGKIVDTGKWSALVVRQWMQELMVKENYVAGVEGTIQID